MDAAEKGECRRVVCGGIHMTDIPGFPYQLLWQERQLLSVANPTRQDGLDFLREVPHAGIRTITSCYPLKEANRRWTICVPAGLRALRY